MRKQARLLPWALCSLTFFFFFFFGAVAVDPLPVYRSIQEKRLSYAGARRETFAADDGTTLSAFILGPLSAERPVVLLHGLGADATYWTDAALFLARHGRTVILPDAPGSGRSEPPRDPKGYGLPGRVAALDSLARALALDKSDLVGHSLGGWTAGSYPREPAAFSISFSSASPLPLWASFSTRSAGTMAAVPRPRRSPTSPRPTASPRTSASCLRARP